MNNNPSDVKLRECLEDPLEIIVADSLFEVGIKFVHEMQNKEQGLDFYLPDYNVYIECKAFYSDRTARQIKDKRVIFIQGKEAAKSFNAMITHQSHLLEMAADALRASVETDDYIKAKQTLLTLQQHGYGKD